MSIEALKDFVLHGKVSEETISKYNGKIPDELLDVWKAYGYGSFFGGYLKTINPDDYQELLIEGYFNGEASIPIFATGFGDIIAWADNEYVTLVKFRKSDTTVLAAGFDFFFDDNANASSRLNRRMDKDLYEGAVSKYGSLEYGECFGFVPLLPMGGKEKIENLQKFDIRTHIDLIIQMVGKIE